MYEGKIGYFKLKRRYRLQPNIVRVPTNSDITEALHFGAYQPSDFIVVDSCRLDTNDPRITTSRYNSYILVYSGCKNFKQALGSVIDEIINTNLI